MNKQKTGSTKTPKNKCPVCEHIIDGTASVENKNHVPNENDITMCINCASVLAFNADLTVKEMTDNEIADLDHDIRQLIQRMRKAIKRTAFV